MKGKFTGALTGAMLAVLLLAAPAAAAAPGNDLPEGAIALTGALPQVISQDTSEATVSSDDVGCGAGGLDQSTVWYTFTPAEFVDLAIDPSASSYLVGVNVFDTTPTQEALIACFQGAATLKLEGGRTYYLMFADTDGDATNGGALEVSLDLPPPPPPPLEIQLTVDATARVSRAGLATVTGTVTCSTETEFLEVGGSIRQTLGRFSIHGGGWTATSCGPAPATWTIEFEGENGKLAGGKAAVELFAVGCGLESCGEATIVATVRLGR